MATTENNVNSSNSKKAKNENSTKKEDSQNELTLPTESAALRLEISESRSGGVLVVAVAAAGLLISHLLGKKGK